MTDPLKEPLPGSTLVFDPTTLPVDPDQAAQRQQESGPVEKVFDTLEAGGLLIDAASLAYQAGGLVVEAGTATVKIAGAGVEIVGTLVGGLLELP